ncbi:MAG: efflux RND transporter periplasmic adaptor subunit [Candidatus Omnitrophota bacterium]|nr:efflux RND transporter periplasmic adaptor subunit [Candidatus Omnitrophota bacterium]
MKFLKKFKFLFIFIIITAGAVLAYLYYNGDITMKKNKDAKPVSGIEREKEKQNFEDNNGYMPVVFVTSVKREDFKNVLSYYGIIKGFRESKLRFAVQGSIGKIHFNEGQKVDKNAIIAVLDQEEIKTKIEYAELEYKNNEKLFSMGAVSKETLEKSKLELRLTRLDLEKTIIKAPCKGIINTINFEEREFVTPQDEIAGFFDINEVFCEIGIPENDISKIRIGQEVEVFIDAYPSRCFTAKIGRILPRMENETRMQIVKIKLPNNEELLKPGMFARTHIITYQKKNALVIPTAALKKTDQTWQVYTVTLQDSKKGIVTLSKVSPGFLGYTWAQINSGVKEGEYIISDAIALKYSLTDNSPVEIILSE